MKIPSFLPKSSTEQLDQRLHAAIAKTTSSLSPTIALLSYIDWATHLAAAPGKQLELLHMAASQTLAPPLVVEQPDWRFRGAEWQQWPYNMWSQSFLQTEQWWHAATHGVRGVAPHHADVVGFAARQWLAAVSPRNFLATNPQVLQRTRKEHGANLARGLQNVFQDLNRRVTGVHDPALGKFMPGRDVAVTPGKVVLKNKLMELIQYTPTTAKVHPEPILIFPAWIMKYYVLDLSPENSLIKYLVDQGHTVFCVSWKNPGRDERDLGMDDYVSLGVCSALAAVSAIVPGRKVHATGYCLGGTLLCIAAATMARDGDDRLASISLLAAQTDFSEPGELSLFIDASQVAMLEAQMADTGYLTADQMAGAFQLLRSDYLTWSYIIDTYLMGERPVVNDLMAWNADATRMPARMHSQYLRRLFLDNDLAQGRYPVNGRPVALTDIRVPIFCLGTETDHVAPWRSVYKLHLLTPAELTFALTSGGHNAGVVSQPGHPRRHYKCHTRAVGDTYLGPDEWLQTAEQASGSWWPAWANWLGRRSGTPVAPPAMGNKKRGYPAIDAAPGSYILER
jgi:polyhydroxyalkanoate synthase